jgi:hypothetical protein
MPGGNQWRKFRANEARYLPGLMSEVQADQVFDVPDGPYADGLAEQPYFEDITPAKRPEKEKN